jgi:hypothetical protein
MTDELWEKAAKALVDDETKNADIKQQTARAVVRALVKDKAKPRGEVLGRLILDLQEFSPAPAYDIPENDRFATAILIAAEYFDRADAFHAARVVAELNNVGKLEDFRDNVRAFNRFACIIPNNTTAALEELIASGKRLPFRNEDGTLSEAPAPVAAPVPASERPAFQPSMGGASA